jgi:hypothetical protein
VTHTATGRACSHGVGAVLTKNCAGPVEGGGNRGGATGHGKAGMSQGLCSAAPRLPFSRPTHRHSHASPLKFTPLHCPQFYCTPLHVAHLAAIGVGPRIRHRQHPRPRVLQVPSDLILKLSSLQISRSAGQQAAQE